MYNLLVKVGRWEDSKDSMMSTRVFEYTETTLINRFKTDDVIDLDTLIKLPCMFMQETSSDGSQQDVKVGYITGATKRNSDIEIEYTLDSFIPPLTNEQIKKVAREFDIEDVEFTRTHWGVKDIDLYKVLWKNLNLKRQEPNIFGSPALIAVMMPFDASFDPVSEKLKDIASDLNLECKRGDDIWESSIITQDIVRLINSSRVVICDCTGRNPNVFYEIGLAHALGKETILIAQDSRDIPFNVEHHRYIRYLNNTEGLTKLGEEITGRLKTLLGA